MIRKDDIHNNLYPQIRNRGLYLPKYNWDSEAISLRLLLKFFFRIWIWTIQVGAFLSYVIMYGNIFTKDEAKPTRAIA